MKQLVLIRHGESVWNVENRFTGWEDVDLTEHGIQEAIEAGTRLCRAGFDFDEVHTSLLKRAIRTTWLVLEAMDLLWIPMYKTWRLNERFYAALQGLNKAETAEQYGAKQVIVWRRSYDVRPPAIDREDGRFPGHDRKYRDIAPDCLPVTESLADTLERLLPYWNASIRPSLEMNRNVLVVAHGNTLRALVKHLEEWDADRIMNLNIPTGVPIVYELDDNLKPIRHYQLAS